MTKDKTVTMSLELASELCAADYGLRRKARSELRALLAANPEENDPCPQCGGSLKTWGCTCEPRWPMYKEILAAPVVERQPEAFMYQHDETGQIGFIDIQQVEWGFEKNNPRLKIICPLYRSPPAPVAVVQQCKIGIYGKAYDAPETKRAYTYEDQPDNVTASKLGKAAFFAKPGGDSIDYGLSLLKSLADEGFGVFEIDKVKDLNQ